jgi:hypothetical protein
MNFLHAYFGSFSCINAYIFKGLLGHKNPVSIYNTANIGPWKEGEFAVACVPQRIKKEERCQV